MENKRDSDNFLTSRQAAHFLNISLSTLKKFIYSGRIKTLKTPGGHHRIRKDDLFKMIDAGAPPVPSDALKDKTLLGIFKGLVNLLEKRQKFCRGHANSVAKISLKIAQKLKFSSEQMERLHLASLLHDIGMLSIDESILNKETKLNNKEYSIIKTHPLLGEEVVKSLRQFKRLSIIIRQHHERYDGAGYPDGLKKDAICPEAKVISLAEAFACMTARDSYRKPLSEKEAIGEIKRNAARQFDPQMVEIFLKIYKNE
ncbi:MAG: hypothetical protein DRP61_03665 [Candidatus Omnitrophota bacterium]|mgnify:FL=1|nr:MAG: hypothetical protein DRP61_03665 [Candidatus Omnitrophota bacterium]